MPQATLHEWETYDACVGINIMLQESDQRLFAQVMHVRLVHHPEHSKN